METALAIIGLLVAVVVLLVGGILARNGLTLIFGSEAAFQIARDNRPPSVKQSLSGNFDPYERRRRDYAVSAGLAVDRNGKLIPQGRLSDEIVDSV